MTSERFDAGGVVAGGLFVVLGILFLLDELDVWGLESAVVWPLVLIGLGLAIGLGALRRREHP